jgi:nucleoside-diphosphate-sugar epimerase
MWVIITGTAGQIGSQLIEELSGKHEFCLIDQHPVAGRMSMIRRPLKELLLDALATLVQDVRIYTLVKGTDVVLHLAADHCPTLRDGYCRTYIELEVICSFW